MNATLTRKRSDQPVDLDALAADARHRIAQLTEQRARLSLDALTGDDERQELANIERELAAARGELERIGLAREESDRREREARERADREAREQAAKRAAKLREQAGKSAKALDEAMRVFADRLAGHRALLAKLQVEQTVAGEHGTVRLEPSQVQSALAFHLREAGAGGAVELGLVGRAAPLAREEGA